ncbi:MAG: hypothetical protein ACI857_002407 [Arenicella sp.]|jgi:hypothetical protein
MRKVLSLLAIVSSSLFIGGCDTEFSLNGDYEIQPIVFGLLDHTQDVHIFKITKAYLGDGDNLVYAQIPDSNYFNQVDAKVTEFKDGDPTGREWTMSDSIITTKSTDGAFYGPEQKVYYFEEANLDSTATYELFIDLENGAHQVTGSTELLPQMRVIKSGFTISPIFKLNLAPSTVDEDSDYSSWNFSVKEALNGAAYSMYYTFRWTETYQDATTASFSITRNFKDFEQSKPLSPGSEPAAIDGLDFYTWLGENIAVDANVSSRQMNGFDIRVACAHTELKQYMDVGEPVSGIAQVQPEYTNLSGARGLFSSRIVMDIYNFQLDANSTKQLCNGFKTGGLGFCSSLPEHSGELWFCP